MNAPAVALWRFFCFLVFSLTLSSFSLFFVSTLFSTPHLPSLSVLLSIYLSLSSFTFRVFFNFHSFPYFLSCLSLRFSRLFFSLSLSRNILFIFILYIPLSVLLLISPWLLFSFSIPLFYLFIFTFPLFPNHFLKLSSFSLPSSSVVLFYFTFLIYPSLSVISLSFFHFIFTFFPSLHPPLSLPLFVSPPHSRARSLIFFG